MTSRERRELDNIMAVAGRGQIRFVGIVSTFRVHLDDAEVMEVENKVVSRATSLSDRVVIFRPGHVLSRHSPMLGLLERLARFYPLFPRRLSSCFLDGTEFFVAIEAVRLAERQHADAPNPGRDRRRHRPRRPRVDPSPPETGPTPSWGRTGRGATCWFVTVRGAWGRSLTTAVSTILSWLLVGQVIGFVFTLLASRFPRMRQWNVHTLRPRSLRELLSLCHRHNIEHVKVVGYNNGVAHFGHRHPGKTIVSTVRCHRMAFAGPNTLKADSGATVRSALDFLARTDQDLYVVPNYSYVSLGTSFFVPIHGSAVDYSTVADTIRRVVLYDPDSDRIIAASRDDAAFREHVYNQQSRAVLLRLYILAKAKSTLFRPS